MPELTDALLNPFRSIFEWILALLVQVNIELPVVAVQAVLAALLALGTWYALRRSRLPEVSAPERLAWTAGTWIFPIVIAAVLLDWSSQVAFPLPDRVQGVFQVGTPTPQTEQCLLITHIELLDFRKRHVVASTGRPDTRTGRFEVTFRPEFSNPPRYLRVASSCCENTEVAITRREIRHRQNFTIPFVLRAGPP